MSVRRLLYLGSTLPQEGPSSSIILQRHFTRLFRHGWQIGIAHPGNLARPTCWPSEWRSIVLPSRRAWWPPVRPNLPLSQIVRRWLVGLEINRHFPLQKGDAIMTLLPDFPEEWQKLAAALSHRLAISNLVMVHDAAEAWTRAAQEQMHFRERTRQRMVKATHAWFISDELASHYGRDGSPNSSVLRPIPAGFEAPSVGWQEHFASHPVLIHSGKLFPEYFPTLTSIAHQAEQAGVAFHVVSSSNTEGLKPWLNENPSITFREFFASNEAGLAFLKRAASMLLVFYPEPAANCTWSATSFPSKLVEYCHLGLPILIVASARTALGRWAASNAWPTWVESTDNEKFTGMLQRLRHRALWEEAAAAAFRVAESEFSPGLIQAQFERELALRPP